MKTPHPPLRAAPLLRRLRLWPAVLAAALVWFAVSACSTRPGPRRGHDANPPQPTLRAEATFFQDALRVRAELAAANLGPPGAPGGGASSRRGSGGPPSGGGGMGGMGGGMGGPGGPPPGDMGGSGEAPVQTLGAMVSMPRMMLRVSLTNEGAEPLEIAVTDLVSALGNFAVRPERLTLAPGQQGALDPVSSSYTENLAELSVELRIRRGTTRETQTLLLVPAAPPAPPAGR